ncbi:MAG: HD domain-containing protein [Planctomycetes bacterium]|nr:HD domain-containing protein [Planctomycetota bacterium]
MSNNIVNHIVDVFNQRGSENYASEAVTQLQHAIQSALLAKRDGADEPLIAAALLHDIGHLLGTASLPNSEAQNYDDKHENKGYGWLVKHFGAQVADPVRLHVAAKRYLCTVDPNYCNILSPTSLKSFHDQGGMMSNEERATFERERYFQEALRLRRWDDEAKDPDIAIPPIEEYRELLGRICAKVA